MRIRAIFFGMVSVVAVGLWSAIQGPGDRLVAASYDKASGTAYTSISDDQGRTWRRQTVPPQDLAAPLEELRLVASPTAQTCGCSGTGRSRRAAWAAPGMSVRTLGSR